MRKLSFNSPTNIKGDCSWENFPDLAEHEKNKKGVDIADEDLELFAKHRTNEN
jgi:hypothetical protein